MLKAKGIKQEAIELLADNESLLDDLRDQIEGTKELLERGHHQQQIAEELLADTDVAKAKAEEAVSRGDEILKTAKNTLRTLQGWYNWVSPLCVAECRPCCSVDTRIFLRHLYSLITKREECNVTDNLEFLILVNCLFHLSSHRGGAEDPSFL